MSQRYTLKDTDAGPEITFLHSGKRGETIEKNWISDESVRERVVKIIILDNVVAIDHFAFHKCSSLTSVVIPESVVAVGMSAFRYCSALTAVVIPGNVTVIHEFAFADCTSLKSISLPDSVAKFGMCVFSGCSALASISVPDRVTVVPYCAFRGCAMLTGIVIPSRVTAINAGAFEGCKALTSIVIPDTVTAIETSAFSKCSALKTVVAFCSPAGAILTVHEYAFHGALQINRVSAPDAVVAALPGSYKEATTLGDLPPAVTFGAATLQMDTYFWSMKLHCKTDRLSPTQRAWVKHLLTVGSRVRLHWRPFNKGPRSVACIPKVGHPALPCIMNDIWLFVLKFVKLSEMGVRPSEGVLDARYAGMLSDSSDDEE